ncbi:MAG TPA: hypothetical protein VGF17_04900 [Phytomonospora sp.]
MFLEQRSWRWLKARIRGLMNRPPTYVASGLALVTQYPTRLAAALADTE